MSGGSANEEYALHISLPRGDCIPAEVSHDPSLLPTFNTARCATTGSTSSAPGADRIRKIQFRSGPRPPLLIRASRWQ